ncbi:hypothetical protein GCM10010129_16230 [Streptomyces fumigatiscleroticus]|nr:hypothetical protein GCM10010129_16230 [Streptomyces fumigatiscleroticus]
MNKFRIGGVTVAAVALIAVAGSPASAGTSVTSYGESTKASCSHGSKGTFDDYGEHFYVTDTCADSMSAVLKVDVAPYQSGGGYDFTIWNPNGSGDTKDVNKSYAEGTGVCIQAGVGEYSSGEWGLWGYWTCGVA